MKGTKPKYDSCYTFETIGGWMSVATCLRCGAAVLWPSHMSHKYEEDEIATNILLHNKWHVQQNDKRAQLETHTKPVRVYEIRKKIINAYKLGITIKRVGLRALTRYIGAKHPQSVKYHAGVLQKRGLLPDPYDQTLPL